MSRVAFQKTTETCRFPQVLGQDVKAAPISVSQSYVLKLGEANKYINALFCISTYRVLYRKSVAKFSGKYSTKTLVLHLKFQLTIMNCPHDPESRTTNLIERFSASNYLPKNNTPAEYITFFTVIAT